MKTLKQIICIHDFIKISDSKNGTAKLYKCRYCNIYKIRNRLIYPDLITNDKNLILSIKWINKEIYMSNFTNKQYKKFLIRSLSSKNNWKSNINITSKGLNLEWRSIEYTFNSTIKVYFKINDSGVCLYRNEELLYKIKYIPIISLTARKISKMKTTTFHKTEKELFNELSDKL